MDLTSKWDASGLGARGFQGVLEVFGNVLLCYAHSHGRGFKAKALNAVDTERERATP
jgi:hypothetical protein